MGGRIAWQQQTALASTDAEHTHHAGGKVTAESGAPTSHAAGWACGPLSGAEPARPGPARPWNPRSGRSTAPDLRMGP